MKCKVIKGYIDKHTKKAYDVGMMYECTDERFKEIQRRGDYLVKVKEKTAERADKEPKKVSKE